MSEQSNTGSISTADSLGNPPRRRIATASQARQILSQAKTDSDLAGKMRSRIQGLIDGNPPEDPAYLQRMGRGSECNANFMEAASVIDAAAAAIYELSMNMFPIVDVECDYSDPSNPALDCGNIIAEELSDTLLSWREFFHHEQVSAYEMVKFGAGPVFFPDARDWHYRSMKMGSLLTPSSAPSTLGEWEVFFIRDRLHVADLYRKISSSEAIEANRAKGWSPGEIRQAIIKAAKAGKDVDRQSVTFWESIQLNFKNNAATSDFMESEEVAVAHACVREVPTQKITHLIFPEDYDSADFIFSKEGEYDNFYQTAALYLWTVGDGYYRSVRGLGHRIYSAMNVSNRFMNRLVTGAMMQAGLLVQGSSSDKMNLVTQGPVTKLPSGLSLVQSSFTPNLAQLASVRDMLRSVIDVNHNAFRGVQAGAERVEKTARQASLEAASESRMDVNRAILYYTQRDLLMAEVFRRITRKGYDSQDPGYEESRDFLKRCEDRGVPKAYITPEYCRVRSARAVGMGSPTMREIATQEGMALLGVRDIDEVGRRRIISSRLSALFGKREADKIFPANDRNQQVTNIVSIISLENNDMVHGQQVMVGSDQPHLIHVTNHIPLIEQVIQEYMKNPDGFDVSAGVLAVRTLLEHSDAHVQWLESDETRLQAASDLRRRLSDLAPIYSAMLRDAKQRQQEAVKRQQQAVADAENSMRNEQDNEARVEMEKVLSRERISLRKLEGQERLREERMLHDMALKERIVNADIALKERMAAAKRPPATPAAER